MKDESRKCQHTPGPWGIRENTNALIPEVSILNDRGYKVAGVGRIHDARLIVAAPDLLEAAETILASLAWAEKHQNITYNGYETLRAAIRKARPDDPESRRITEADARKILAAQPVKSFPYLNNDVPKAKGAE